MTYQKYNSKRKATQLSFDFDGWPVRGLLRVLALAVIYRWPHLGALAEQQLRKWEARQ